MSSTQDNTNTNIVSPQISVPLGVRLSPQLNTIARLEKRRSKLYEVRDSSRIQLHQNENEIYYGLRFQCPEIMPPLELFIRAGLRCFEGIDIGGAINRMDPDVRSRFTECLVKHRTLAMFKLRVDKRMAEVQSLLDAARAEAADSEQSGQRYREAEYCNLS
ncbi:uncharacterized protein LAJ45_00041 [Morchella importuna]|uniref:uncharacterized protein n=1 Tax=Morchella importuna TaxID=1174673 RepID=UPI001E8E59C8|nr:uncharacterized protein LAJ45_00041 [Morchella importuna]KAH8155033.1 hypothetical protein LAJ45_00041 [Morchella importuna]